MVVYRDRGGGSVGLEVVVCRDRGGGLYLCTQMAFEYDDNKTC